METKMDAYLRVSRVGGRDKKNGGDSFHSPDEQEARIREWARLNKVTIGEVVSELDVSGGLTVKERLLERLVQRCEDGESKGIVVYSFDRFTREHPYEAPATLARLRDARCALRDVVNGFDSSTPMGEQMAGLLIAQAYGVRHQAKERNRASVQRAIESGKYVACGAPYGYVEGPFAVAAFTVITGLLCCGAAIAISR